MFVPVGHTGVVDCSVLDHHLLKHVHHVHPTSVAFSAEPSFECDLYAELLLAMIESQYLHSDYGGATSQISDINLSRPGHPGASIL